MLPSTEGPKEHERGSQVRTPRVNLLSVTHKVKGKGEGNRMKHHGDWNGGSWEQVHNW